MERARAAAALLVLAACLACSAAAPVNEQTGLDLYDGGAKEGCYYNFQHYGEGDRIMTNEPCLNCTCHNRMLMCYLRVCPFTKPIGQDCTIEKRGDQCCPVITCPDVHVDLLTSTSTTSPAEYGSSEVGHLEKYGCSINGKFYSEGSKVPPTPNKPCELCYCIRNMTACVMQECTLHVDGCTPVYLKDVCCPVRYSCDHTEDEILMLDDMTTTVRPTPGFLLTTTVPPGVTQDCVHDDEVFADGALIKTEKACEHCYCMKGDIVCVVQECGTPMENEGKNCTSLPPREGQCCPDTYICEGDSMIEDTTNDNELLTTYLPTRETIPQVEIEGSGYDQPNVHQAVTISPLPEEEQEGSGLQSTATIVGGEDVTAEPTRFEQSTPTEDLFSITPNAEEPVKSEGELISKESEPSKENEIVPTTEKAVEKELGETHQEEMITSIPSVSLGEPPIPSDQVTEKSKEESPTSKLPDISDYHTSPEYSPNISEHEKESTTTIMPMESIPQKESAPKLDEQPIEKADEKSGEKLSTPYPYEQSTERHEEGAYEPVTEKSIEQSTVKLGEPVTQIYEQFTKKSDEQSTDKIDEKLPKPIDRQPIENPEEELTEKMEELSPTKISEQSTEEVPITETSAEKSTESEYVQSTDKLDEQATEKLDVKPTEKPTEKSTEKSNKEVPEKVDDKTTEKIDEHSTEKLYEATSEKAAEIPTEKVDEYSHKKPDEESTIKNEDQSTEKLYDLSTENPEDKFTENEQLPEKVYEQSTEKIDEQPTEKIYEQSTETLDEMATVKVHEQSTEKLDENSIDKLSEATSEKAYEKPTEKLEESSTEKVDENLTEKLDESTEIQYEATSEKIYEIATSTDKLDDAIEKGHDKSTEKLDESATEKYEEHSTEKLDADSTEEPFKAPTDERSTEKFDEQSTEKLPEQHTEGYEVQPTEKITDERLTERPDVEVTSKLEDEITISSVPPTAGTLLPEQIVTDHTFQNVPSTPEPVEEGSGEPGLSDTTESVEYQQTSSTTTPIDGSEPAGMPHISPVTDNVGISTSSESIPIETTEGLEEKVLTTLTPVSEKDEEQDIDHLLTTEISKEEQPTDFEQKQTTLSSTELDHTTPRSISDVLSETSVDKQTEIDDAKTNAPNIASTTTYSDLEFDSSTQSNIKPEMQTTERTNQATSEVLPTSGIERTTHSEPSISAVTTESNEHPLPTSGLYDLPLDDKLKAPTETAMDIEKTSVVSVLEPEVTTVGFKETINYDQPTQSEETSDIFTEAPAIPDTTEIVPESPEQPGKETDVGMATEVTDNKEVTPGITSMSDIKEIDSTSPSVPVTEPSPDTVAITETLALSTSTSAPKVESMTETTTTVSDQNIVTLVPDLSENEINEEESGMGHILPHIPGEGDCLVDGITYTNDSSIPSTNKCQNSCKCVSSIVKCEPIQCSPPPENMINCQPMYDAKESCCPTYVCDNAKETVPPESHNQMLDLTTQLPAIEKEYEPSVIPGSEKPVCSSGECEAKEEVIVPVQVPECTSEGCLLTPGQVIIPNRASDETISSEKDKSPMPDCQSDNCIQSIPIVPVVVGAPEECTQESCTPTKKDSSKDSQTPIVPPSESTSELPVVSCSGEDCAESSASMSSNLPTDDCKSADCKQSVSTIPSEQPTISTSVISEETPSDECKSDDCRKPGSVLPETQYSTETLSEVTSTESVPEIISCKGDECKISPSVNAETTISDECTSGDCKKPASIPSDIPVSVSTPCLGYKCDEPNIATPEISPSEGCKSGDCASTGSISTEISPDVPCIGDQCNIATTAISDISPSEDCKNGDCSPNTISPAVPTIVSCEGKECDKPTTLSSDGPSSEECNDGDCEKQRPSDIPVSVSTLCIGEQCDGPKVVMPESSYNEGIGCTSGNCAPGLTSTDIPTGAPCTGDQCNQPRPVVAESPLIHDCKGDDCTPVIVSPETGTGVLCEGGQCEIPTTIISGMPSSEECKGSDCIPGSDSPDITAGVSCTDDQCTVSHTPELQTDVPARDSSTTCKDGKCEIPVQITPIIPAPHDIPCIGDQCSIPVDTSPHISESCKSGDCESPISETPNTEIPVDISEGSPSVHCKDAECKKPSIVTSETQKPLDIPCNGKDCDVSMVTQGDADFVTSKAPEVETTELGEKDTMDQDHLTTETSVSDVQKITTESNIQTTKLDYEVTTPAIEQKEPDSQGPNEIDDLLKPTEPSESKDSETSTPSTESKSTTEQESTESKPSIHPVDESSIKPTNAIDEAFNEIPINSTDDKYGGGSSPTEHLPTESAPIDKQATDKTGDGIEPTTLQSTVILSEETSTPLHSNEEVPTEKPSIDELEKQKEEDIEKPVTEETIPSEKELTTPKTNIETTVVSLPEEPSFGEATTEKIISDITTSITINEETTINNEIQPITIDTSNEDGAVPTESSSEQAQTTLQEMTTAYSVELDEHVHEPMDQEKTESEKPHSEKPDIQEGPSTTFENMEITTDSVLKEKETPAVESHTIDTEAPETNVKPEEPHGAATVDDSSITEEPVLISEVTGAHTISEATTPKIISSTERITEQEVITESTAVHDSEPSSVSQVVPEQPTEKSDKESVIPAVTESYTGHEPEKESTQTTEKPMEEEIIAATETEPKLQTETPESVTNVPAISSSISYSESDQHITDIPPHEYESMETSDEKLHDDSDIQTTDTDLHYTVETDLGTPGQTESTNILKETTPQNEEFMEYPDEAHKTSISLPSEDENALQKASTSAGEGPEEATRSPEKEISENLPVDTTKTEESNEIEPAISEETKPEDFVTTSVPVTPFEKDIDQTTIKSEYTNVQMSETSITESSDKSSSKEPNVTDLPHVSEEHEIQPPEQTSPETALHETESPYTKSTELIPAAITEPFDLTNKYNTIASEETTSKFDEDQAPTVEIQEKEQVTTSSDHYYEGGAELTTMAQPVKPEFDEEPTTLYDKPLSTDSEYLEPSTSASRPVDVTPAEEDKFSAEVTKQPHTSEKETTLELQPSTSKTPLSVDDSVTEDHVPHDLGTEQYEPTTISEPIVTDKPAISDGSTVAQEEPKATVTAQPEPSVQPDVIPTQAGTEEHTPYDATTHRFDEELPKITTSAPQSTELYETPSSMSPTVELTVTEESSSAQPESEQETIKPDQLNKDTVNVEPTPITNAPVEVPITSEEPSAAPITPVTPEKPQLPSDDKTQSTPVSAADEEPKPVVSDELPGGSTGPGDLPSPGEDVDHQSPDQFPSPGYGAEPDYEEEDQAFGPGTCRYGGKVYVSAQQIPRDDPCDFCFCFRSDIICLQQSCPPPIHGCHEEPINGFCCPRYECPVSMATTLNVTTTTTTTTTTLPPHFLPHAYKGAAQRRGCHIKGHSYQVGEVVRASSGPCLHCTCGGDGQMKCDPKVCTPEPMLRQMIAAAVSSKRRR